MHHEEKSFYLFVIISCYFWHKCTTPHLHLNSKKKKSSNKQIQKLLKQSGEKNPIHKTGIEDSYSNNTHILHIKKNTNLFRFWIKSILYVTFSNNSKMSDNLDSTRAQHVVFWIGKCLTWSNNNGLSSVDTKWINILHVTNLQGNNDGLVKNLTLYLSKVANPARACASFRSMKIYKVLLLPWSITGYCPPPPLPWGTLPQK